MAVYSPISTELEEAIEWLAEVTHKFEEVDATMKESGTSFDQAVEVLNRGVLLKFKIVRGIQKQTVDTPFMMDLATTLEPPSKTRIFCSRSCPQVKFVSLARGMP